MAGFESECPTGREGKGADHINARYSYVEVATKKILLNSIPAAHEEASHQSSGNSNYCNHNVVLAFLK